jgi:hypothetical protein
MVVLVDVGLFVEEVQQGDVEFGGGSHEVADAAEYAQVYFFVRIHLFYYLQEELLL